MLWNPFFPRQRRGKWQYIIQPAIFLAIIAAYVWIIRWHDKAFFAQVNLLLLIAKVIMIVIGWVAIVASLFILFRKGTNQTLRNLALRRQLTFLFLFTFWHTMFSILFYDTGLLSRLNLGPGAIRFITIYLQVIGIPSAIMRLSEPFVWHNL